MDGYLPIVEAAFKLDLANDHRIAQDYAADKSTLYHHWLKSSHTTLCSMGEEIVRAFAGGNLLKEYLASKRLGTDLHKRLDAHLARSDDQPSVYTRLWADDNGDSLSRPEIKMLIQTLRNYSDFSHSSAKHDSASFEIDEAYDQEWTVQESNRGSRRLLEATLGTPSEKRVRDVVMFCDALEEHIANPNSILLDRLLKYVGYAINAVRRKAGHDALGSSSSWFATLLMSISKVLFGERFKFHTFVLCPLADEKQGHVAEMLLTTIGSAYYWTGLGCSIGDAGHSQTSIWFQKLTVEERHEKWEDYRKWIVSNTPWVKESEKNTVRTKAFLARHRDDLKARTSARLKANRDKEAADKQQLAYYVEVTSDPITREIDPLLCAQIDKLVAEVAAFDIKTKEIRQHTVGWFGPD
jgi:hypothetical protein